MPVPVMVPTAAFPLATPSTDHDRVVAEPPMRVAVNEAVAPVFSVVELGFTVTLVGVGGTLTVIVEDADLLESAVLVAVKVWLPAEEGAT